MLYVQLATGDICDIRAGNLQPVSNRMRLV